MRAGGINGTALNQGGGNVTIVFDSGTTYTPGGKVHVTLTITDSKARLYGFQVSSRLSSNTTNGQAGSFIKGTQQLILCEDGSVLPAAGCRSSAPLQFIEHSSPFKTNVISFDWNAPATDVGNVVFYAAANAANGDSNNTGDHIYTTSATLTPAATNSNRPAISPGGIADAFTYTAGVSTQTWIAIFGTNLASATKTWDGDPAFAEGRLPTSVNGVSVTVNGKAAPVYFVSPTQIDILGPTDSATGTVSIVVTNENGASDSFAVNKAATLPAFYAPFSQNGKLFVTAVSTTGALLGKAGVDPRVTRGVKPGDTVLLFGTGWGATTDSSITTDMATFTPAPLATQPTITIGGQPAQIAGGAGFLISPGLYQFNVIVPNVPDGDQVISATLGSVTTAVDVLVAVQR